MTIIAAATRLFSENGWSGTGTRDVARAAQVSVETVYANFGSKGALLRQALDVAVVGDDEPVPLSDRPEFRVLAAGDARARAQAAGRLLAVMHRRTAALYRVLQHAAAADAEMADLLRTNQARERAQVRESVLAVTRREVTETEVDAMYAVLGNDVFLLLTETTGWSDDQYASWVAATVTRLLDLGEDWPMNDDLDQPADTRLMGIVHDALRRDLDRARAAISAPPFPADAQRVAIAQHLGWMMGFLHNHHEPEDRWLYPLVRQRDPAASPLLDAMDAEHHAIGPAITGLTGAAAAYAAAPAAREGLVPALDQLTEVLYPHLRREEDEMMPVVSASVTEAEWQQWDHEHNVKPLGPLELADTGLWILDDLDEADRAKVTGLVPAVPRWIILHLLAGRYRRAAYRRWRLAGHSAYKTPQAGQAEVTTTAPPEAVWAILADVTRVGEWSHECRSAAWADGSQAGPGARFRGRNKSGSMRWSRSCTVVSWEPSRELAYRTSGGAAFADSTEWRFTLTPADGGRTVIRQSFRVVSLRLWTDRVIWALIPAHHDRLAALRADLGRLAAIAESEAARLLRWPPRTR